MPTLGISIHRTLLSTQSSKNDHQAKNTDCGLKSNNFLEGQTICIIFAQ